MRSMYTAELHAIRSNIKIFLSAKQKRLYGEFMSPGTLKRARVFM